MKSNLEKNMEIKRAKTQWHLFPWEQLQEAGDLITDGAIKYTKDNWQTVEPETYRSAIMRHIIAYMSGEKIDPESGKSHLSHVICNALFLRWFDK